MSNPLVKEFTYNVPIVKVWQAITSTDMMKRWYFPQLRKFKPEVGFKLDFDDDSAQYQKEWIVTKVEEGQTLAHSWAYRGYPGISNVKFDLLSENSTTRLRVTQTDLETFPNHPHFQRERFESGWDNLLGKNLRELLETD